MTNSFCNNVNFHKKKRNIKSRKKLTIPMIFDKNKIALFNKNGKAIF